MKKFSVFRYLKQFSLLIFVLSIVGSLAIYSYGKSRQSYIASTVIQYTNNGVKNGYTPDGSPLNVEEIYSSMVIDGALKDLGYQTNIDAIRSNCYVEEVIPETQQKLNEALLDKGEESTYIADTYKVYYIGDSSTDEDYAWNVLDAIMKNYYEFYTEKYVEEQLPSNGVSVLAGGEYDYLESAQIIDDSVSQMLDYLQSKSAAQPYFRSVETGYTYTDLYNIFNYIYSYEIPSLYAAILANAESADAELLVARLTKECDDLRLLIDNRKQQAEYLKKLIDNYSERNKEMMDYHYHSSNSQEIGTEYILKDVERDSESGDKETTYDELIRQYVDLNTDIQQNKLELEHKEYLLSVLETADRAQGQETPGPDEMQEKIDHCTDLVTRYYRYLEETGHELNRHLGANYLTMVSSINVEAAVNIRLYVIIAIVLFALVGGIIAVLLGRTLDFIDYFTYVDKTVGLSNRAKCDAYIEEHSDKLLKDNFACMAVSMDSLSNISKEYGRATGDAVLKDFATILKSFGDLYGFVGYNGSGMFMAFFPECTSNKLNAILEAIARQVDEYNKQHLARVIRFSCGKAVSSQDGIFEIRDLLRLTMQRMNASKAAGGANSATEKKDGTQGPEKERTGRKDNDAR